MKTIVRRNVMLKGTRTNAFTSQPETDERKITKMTAIPIPIEFSTFFVTPMNGQRPSIFERTKLFTRTVERRIRTSSAATAPS
jgi:hypothetical protein